MRAHTSPLCQEMLGSQNRGYLYRPISLRGFFEGNRIKNDPTEHKRGKDREAGLRFSKFHFNDCRISPAVKKSKDVFI